MERFRKVDDGDGAKRTARWTDPAASAEKFVNPGFFTGILSGIDTVRAGTIDRA